MRKFLSLAAAALLLTGCATVKNITNVKKRSWNCGVESLDLEGYQKVYLPYVKAASIRFLPEGGREDYWQTPEETERLGTGDCEDFGIYLNHLWNKNELLGRVVIGHALKKEPKKWHVWNEINWKGEDYLVDASWKVFIKKKDKRPEVYIEDKWPNSLDKFTNLALRELSIGLPVVYPLKKSN